MNLYLAEWACGLSLRTCFTRRVTNRVDKSLVNHVYTPDECYTKACKGLGNYQEGNFLKSRRHGGMGFV